MAQFLQNVDIGDNWIEDLTNQINAVLVNENTICFPEKLAKGFIYFKEIIPGITVQISDFIYFEEIIFSRMPSKKDFYILYYDVNDGKNGNNAFDSERKEDLEYITNMRPEFGLLSSEIKNYYVPPLLEQTYIVRILISKVLFDEYLQKNTSKSIAIKKLQNKKSSFYYDYIDSRTRVLLLKLKNSDHKSPVFGFILTGLILKILACAIERLADDRNLWLRNVVESDVEQIRRCRKFLLDHINEAFPGINYLSNMAGMCSTKFVEIFKKKYNYSPHQFFIIEKMLVAKTLLKSGKYKNIKDVSYDVGFNSQVYFNKVYYAKNGILPKDDFVELVE